jgi:hypothetical protein
MEMTDHVLQLEAILHKVQTGLYDRTNMRYMAISSGLELLEIKTPSTSFVVEQEEDQSFLEEGIFDAPGDSQYIALHNLKAQTAAAIKLQSLAPVLPFPPFYEALDSTQRVESFIKSTQLPGITQEVLKFEVEMKLMNEVTNDKIKNHVVLCIHEAIKLRPFEGSNGNTDSKRKRAQNPGDYGTRLIQKHKSALLLIVFLKNSENAQTRFMDALSVLLGKPTVKNAIEKLQLLTNKSGRLQFHFLIKFKPTNFKKKEQFQSALLKYFKAMQWQSYKDFHFVGISKAESSRSRSRKRSNSKKRNKFPPAKANGYKGPSGPKFNSNSMWTDKNESTRGKPKRGRGGRGGRGRGARGSKK